MDIAESAWCLQVESTDAIIEEELVRDGESESKLPSAIFVQCCRRALKRHRVSKIFKPGAECLF